MQKKLTLVTTIFYLAAKSVSFPRAQSQIKQLLQPFKFAPVNRNAPKDTLEVGFTDHGAVLNLLTENI